MISHMNNVVIIDMARCLSISGLEIPIGNYIYSKWTQVLSVETQTAAVQSAQYVELESISDMQMLNSSSLQIEF